MLGREGKRTQPGLRSLWSGEGSTTFEGAGFWRSGKERELEEGTRSCLSWQGSLDSVLIPC